MSKFWVPPPPPAPGTIARLCEEIANGSLHWRDSFVFESDAGLVLGRQMGQERGPFGRVRRDVLNGGDDVDLVACDQVRFGRRR